jgi:DNA repair protein RadD
VVIRLYPDQAAGLSSIVAAIRSGHDRVVFKLPTGGGKTVIAAKMAEGAVRKRNRMYFVVDAISLIDQTVQRFYENGIRDVGVIQAEHPATNYAMPVQVASIQTLDRRTKRRSPTFDEPDRMVRDFSRLPDADLVVVDECHCQYAVLYEWMQWCREQGKRMVFVGLSATPYARGMGRHWDQLVVGGSLREMIAAGRLSQYKIFAASHPDLTGVRTRLGDYVESELSEAMQAGALVGDTVKHWLKHGQGRPTLAYCVDRTHAKHMQQQFESAGIPAGYIDAHVEAPDRQLIADQFHRGDLKIVVSVGCLTKGVDWDVRCIILARPTRSESLYLQIVGRGLRVAEGKDYCLILDHSDTALRLGFPEEVDERNTELDDGERRERAEREEKERLPKECGSCGFLKPAKVHACPACGFAPQPQYAGEEVAAELEELVPAAQRALNRKTTPEQKGKFFAGLKHIAAERGYKPGWAANKYRQKFGVWPNAYKDVDPQPPSAEVSNWVKSQQIRWAKRRAA